MGPYWDWAGPWHMWGFGWMVPLLMMVFMVALCAFVMARMMGHGHSGERAGFALALLSERFAKGEISKEEFEEKRAVLARTPG